MTCWPPKSVSMVENVLEEFKARVGRGREFWIRFQGRSHHIRCFAVRDREVNYRGTLEVSRGVKGIRALEGERRRLAGNEKSAGYGE